MKKVFVGMSAGVDSTVSALLLKQQGYDVHGIHMTNWDSRNETSNCPSEQDWKTVVKICQKLNIKSTRVNFIKEYWNEVFTPFLDGITLGITPNPDIKCNSMIKFRSFYDYCKSQKCDYIAFGHYARTKKINSTFYLQKGLDEFKDQSYYLSDISNQVLKDVLFPIGHLNKEAVKRIAIENGFREIAEKKESMGICFIGKRKFGAFLEEYIEQKPGNFITENGTIVGVFKGIGYYTIGQKAPLGGRKWFVLKKDVESNTITVVDSLIHTGFFRNFAKCNLHWISGKPDLDGIFEVKYRYRTNAIKAKVNETGLVEFLDQGAHCLALGQQMAFYRDDICYGGGSINEIL